MSSPEVTSSIDQLVAINNARILSIGWIWSPLKDFAAKIAQALGLKYGTNLSPSEQIVIDQYYKSRGKITQIVPEVTKNTLATWTIPANNEKYQTAA